MDLLLINYFNDAIYSTDTINMKVETSMAHMAMPIRSHSTMAHGAAHIPANNVRSINDYQSSNLKSPFEMMKGIVDT